MIILYTLWMVLKTLDAIWTRWLNERSQGSMDQRIRMSLDGSEKSKARPGLQDAGC